MSLGLPRSLCHALSLSLSHSLSHSLTASLYEPLTLTVYVCVVLYVCLPVLFCCYLSVSVPGCLQVLFIEVSNTDEQFLNENYRANVRCSPDYAGVGNTESAFVDYRRRVDNYSTVFEPIDDQQIHPVRGRVCVYMDVWGRVRVRVCVSLVRERERERGQRSLWLQSATTTCIAL